MVDTPAAPAAPPKPEPTEFAAPAPTGGEPVVPAMPPQEAARAVRRLLLANIDSWLEVGALLKSAEIAGLPGSVTTHLGTVQAHIDYAARAAVAAVIEVMKQEG